MHWLERKLSKWFKPSLLKSLLEDYPPYEQPFPGPAKDLTDDQARQNLSYLLDNRALRIELLGDLLSRFQIEPVQTVESGDFKPLIESLYQWVGTHWKELHTPALAAPHVWHYRSRAGDRILYSLFMDIAILIGEIIIHRHPSYHWAVDLDLVNIKDSMPTVKRPVLQLIVNDKVPPILIDVEAIVAERYRRIDCITMQIENRWMRIVTDTVDGAYEQVWLDQEKSNRAS